MQITGGCLCGAELAPTWACLENAALRVIMALSDGEQFRPR